MIESRCVERGSAWKRPQVLTAAFLLALTLGAASQSDPASESASQVGRGGALPNPILFVTQFPIPSDFTTIGSVFGNHRPEMTSAGRGGDLHLLYPDGTLRNLTLEAGFGMSGFQGAGAIAVRDPEVHWDGQKAVFSMVVGAPEQRFEVIETYWQLYEVTGLGPGQTAVITKVPNQPPDFNNVSPVYATDERILFISDRPRNGARHLYPQHDEYETAASNTGVWSLDPASGELELLDHAPSGDFDPTVDSFGRVIFTRWDHLQRDQQADADALGGGNVYGTFNFVDESAGAARIPRQEEVYPEPRPDRTDLLAGTNLEGHRFNHFFPWMARQDGRELETLNHVGRHELHGYFNRSINDDPNVEEFIAAVSGRFNTEEMENFLQIREDPTQPGLFFGIDAPEFQTHASGQIISLSGPPTLPADVMPLVHVTHPDTGTVTPEGGTPPANHTGFLRNPLPMSDGTLLAAHTAETRADQNEGTRQNPQSRYDFRIKRMTLSGSYWVPGTAVTPVISKTLSYWDPDEMVQYSGPLWQLDPVEVRVRPRPTEPAHPLPAPEASVFADEGVDPASFRQYLESRGLALIVSRNVTTRDEADRQQPFNLSVPGGVSTTGASGTMYAVAHLQIFQADQIRGIGGIGSPRDGRRVLAQPLHDPAVANPPNPGGPPGSVALGLDGSSAALVPSRRALTWQLTDSSGEGMVRERYWLTFQPGEIRVCASCHGLNSQDQAGGPVPTNPPEALRALLQHWKANAFLFTDGFETGDTSAWSGVVGQ
ncbi:MAG: hypothetical protein KDD47_04670 [Acidobacteria bacterium]|nr:hypothetical protein [Acidobacteriota bacterium]